MKNWALKSNIWPGFSKNHALKKVRCQLPPKNLKVKNGNLFCCTFSNLSCREVPPPPPPAKGKEESCIIDSICL